MELRHYIELYQHPAASSFQCIFAWLLITVYANKFIQDTNNNNVYENLISYLFQRYYYKPKYVEIYLMFLSKLNCKNVIILIKLFFYHYLFKKSY